MIFQSRFGAAQTALGYQFYDATGALLGSRVTAGISALPETGSYVATATPPANTVGIYWNDTVSGSKASEDLREALSSPDVPTESEIAAAVRTNLNTELARIDVTFSSVGGLSEETIAALDGADQIFLAAPYVPDESPVLVIPAPDGDESLTVVYIHTEDITNEKTAGLVIILKLLSAPAKSERVLAIAAKTMTTDDDGYAQITVQRDLKYRVTCRELALNNVIEPTAETFNLLSIIP